MLLAQKPFAGRTVVPLLHWDASAVERMDAVLFTEPMHYFSIAELHNGIPIVQPFLSFQIIIIL
jgi:hypothetical protein